MIDRGSVCDRNYNADRDCPRGYARSAPAGGALHDAAPSCFLYRDLSPNGDSHDVLLIDDGPHSRQIHNGGYLGHDLREVGDLHGYSSRAV